MKDEQVKLKSLVKNDERVILDEQLLNKKISKKMLMQVIKSLLHEIMMYELLHVGKDTEYNVISYSNSDRCLEVYSLNYMSENYTKQKFIHRVRTRRTAYLSKDKSDKSLIGERKMLHLTNSFIKKGLVSIIRTEYVGMDYTAVLVNVYLKDNKYDVNEYSLTLSTITPKESKVEQLFGKTIGNLVKKVKYRNEMVKNVYRYGKD